MEAPQQLTNLQQELLAMFSVKLSEQQLLEVKDLLNNYLFGQVTADVDALFDAKGWGEEKIQEWASEHMRTKYEPK